MIKLIEHITQVSVLDQFGSGDLLSLNRLEYEDSVHQSGAFGNIFPIISVDGVQKKKLLVKIYTKEADQLHGYKTITLLHGKLREQQLVWGVTSIQKFPELIGLPFLAFHGTGENGEALIAFVMYDLNVFGFSDLGDGNVQASQIITKLDVRERVYLAYRLSAIVDLFRKIGFVHSDLKHESLFVHIEKCQLAIIDYDSGYHIKLQSKPSTLGARTRWLAMTAWHVLTGKLSSNEITDDQRISNENWTLGCAIFEVIYGTVPYFHLVSNDEKTITEYVSKYTWPEISTKSELMNRGNAKGHSTFLELFSDLNQNGLAKINDAFVKLFNAGVLEYKERPLASTWKSLLHDICKVESLIPEILQFNSDTQTIHRINERVKFEWKVKFADRIYFNKRIVTETTDQVIESLVDGGTIQFTAENDFGSPVREIVIDARRIDPKIVAFSSNIQKRVDLSEVILTWESVDSERVVLTGVLGNQAQNGTVTVDPRARTIYKLTAYGNFDQEISSEIEVTVSAPEVLYFTYAINIEKGIDNIDLTWKVADATNVIIEPRVGNVGVEGSTSIGIFETTEFEIHAAGLFGETRKKILTKPFPMPIIRELLVPMPLIKLEYEFDARTLEIPAALLTEREIKFNSSINFRSQQDQFHTTVPEFVQLIQIRSTRPRPSGWFNQIFERINKLTKAKKDDETT